MNFKNLLDKYKDGNASTEEIKLIEEELNKHEAIGEYLSESYDIGFEEDILQGDIKKETTFVKKSVNKKLRKVILQSVGAVFSILFTIFYIISPLVNNCYYNPSDKTVGKGQEDLYFDLKAFTELNLPGYATSGLVITEKLGFGVYNISFGRQNLFNGETKDINAKIKRNDRIGTFQDFFTNDHFGFYSIKEASKNKDNFMEVQKKETNINYMKELNPVSYISAYIIFEKDLNMKEFEELTQKYNNKIKFTWVGVRTESEETPVNYLSGFNPNLNDGSSSNDSADKNKYPYLQLLDWMTDEENNNKQDMAEAYTKHFSSLLKYMNDRQRAVKVLDHNSIKGEYYKDSLIYVEKSGVNTYGVLVYGEARELLEFINNEKIKNIEIDNVAPSKYIHY